MVDWPFERAANTPGLAEPGFPRLLNSAELAAHCPTPSHGQLHLLKGLSLPSPGLPPLQQIAERGPLAAALPGDGIDRRLAAAQQRLLDGELLSAAAELQAAVAGTAAAPVVAAWARSVRVRALAEQSAALLEAHAAAETASLA